MSSTLVLIILTLGASCSKIDVRADATTLTLTPATTVGPPPDVGATFTLTLHVTGVTNLWSWVIGLKWDPAILDLQSMHEVQTFINSDSAGTIWGPGAIHHSTGVLDEVSDTRLSNTGVSGDGDLATFTFKVVGHSNTPSQIQITGDQLFSAATGNPMITSYTKGPNPTFTFPGGGGGVTHSLIVVSCGSGGTPLQGVSVSISGPESQTLTSNGTGVARFDVTHTGSYSVSGSKSGYQSAAQSVSVVNAGET